MVLIEGHFLMVTFEYHVEMHTLLKRLGLFFYELAQYRHADVH